MCSPLNFTLSFEKNNHQLSRKRICDTHPKSVNDTVPFILLNTAEKFKQTEVLKKAIS